MLALTIHLTTDPTASSWSAILTSVMPVAVIATTAWFTFHYQIRLALEQIDLRFEEVRQQLERDYIIAVAELRRAAGALRIRLSDLIGASEEAHQRINKHLAELKNENPGKEMLAAWAMGDRFDALHYLYSAA